jgi:hypothetical protein
MSPGNDRCRPAGAASSVELEATTNRRSSVTVTGRVCLNIARYVDDVGFVPDSARAAMSFPSVPDGVSLVIDLGRAEAWPAWLWEPLGADDAPHWSSVEVRGTGNVGAAVAAIRAVLADG